MELEIIKTLQANGSETLDVFCKVFSYLSSYVGFLFLFVAFLMFKSKKFALNLGITYGISVACNYALKAIIARPRPYVVDTTIINKLEAVGNSFPSGHSLSGTIISCYLIYLILKKCKNKFVKTILISLVVIFLAFVLFSRMYLGQHYLSDTIAGVILGLIFSIIGIKLLEKN